MATSPSKPWSAFHSSLAASARTPGTPVRQQERPNEKEESATALELLQGFSTLDLLLEYKLLCLNCPTGVYVLPSTKSLYEWHGVLFVHSGPYREGIFKLTIYIPDSFPRMRPMLRFRSKVYHPYVHSHNGVLNMSRVFPTWDPDKHHLWHVLHYMKECFYNSDTWRDCEHPAFMAQAQQCAVESLATLYSNGDNENDGNPIRFGEFDDKLFAKAKKTLLKGDLPEGSASTPSLFSNVTEQFKQLWERMIPR